MMSLPAAKWQLGSRLPACWDRLLLCAPLGGTTINTMSPQLANKGFSKLYVQCQEAPHHTALRPALVSTAFKGPYLLLPRSPQTCSVSFSSHFAFHSISSVLVHLVFPSHLNESFIFYLLFAICWIRKGRSGNMNL